MQQDTTIKNLDTLVTLKTLIIMQKDKQLNGLDSTVKIKEKQLEQTTKQIMSLTKENKRLNLYKNILIGIIPVVIIETLIIILK
jgi:hypothetical protein